MKNKNKNKGLAAAAAARLGRRSLLPVKRDRVGVAARRDLAGRAARLARLRLLDGLLAPHDLHAYSDMGNL